MTRKRILVLPFAGLLFHCGSSPTPGKTVEHSDAGSLEPGGQGDGDQGGPASLGDGDDHTLSAQIRDPRGLEIELVTLSCAGECAEVEAVASGGNPGYAFTWSDGEAAARRAICVDKDSDFEVTVRDTPIELGEFPYAGQTTKASVTARVLGCPGDGGAPAAGDAFCFDFGSFEGPPSFGTALLLGSTCVLTSPATPNGFTSCTCTPDTLPGTGGSALPAFEGGSYMGVSVMPTGLVEVAGSSLCEPLEAGREYAFSIQLADAAFVFQDAHPFPGGGGPVLEIWGASASCGKEELLWRSPAIENVNQWQKYCGSFKPKGAYTSLAFVPAQGPTALPANGSYVIMDALLPGDICGD